MKTTADRKFYGQIGDYNVTWKSPSLDSSGSMPLGNGDIGLNVWVEENGDLVFYLSKTDAWNENGRLIKLGRVRVSFDPTPFRIRMPFRQHLDLETGTICINAGSGPARIQVRLWVDANRPVVRLEVDSQKPMSVTAAVEIWRTHERDMIVRKADGPLDFLSSEQHSPIGLTDHRQKEKVYPDTVIPMAGNRILWCHRNAHSIWKENLRGQDLGHLIDKGHDPLLNRTFGVFMRGEGLVRRGNRKLESAQPATRFVLSLYPLTAQTDTLDDYVLSIERSARHCDATALGDAYTAHSDWWRSFWERSWIHVRGTPEAEAVAKGYQLQRFINACGGRGAHPIKFNGSIFTVDSVEPAEPYDADYRRWGGAYWFQNTRLPYWSMIMSGDVDLVQPLFRMYRDALPLAEKLSRTYFGHGGAFFSEIITFWGTHLNWAYGFDRRSKKPGCDYYIGTAERYWQGMLELLAMMLDVYAVSRDERFLRDPLLKLARSFLRFFREHFPRHDDQGKMMIKPSQALETWQWAVNPMPDVAGLSWTLDRLLELPTALVPERDRRVWSAMRSVLPPIPMRREQTTPEKTPSPWFLVPGREYDLGGNAENAELYAVFPYRLFGVGKPHLEAARLTFTQRSGRLRGGWTQDAIHAAMLGLTDEAMAGVVHNFTTKHDKSRFPAFWGPNFDWIPDQDHGSTAMIALQRMLMQWDQGKIRLLTAWPLDWEADFKLHAPGRTIVQGHVKDGRITALNVTPGKRAADVVVCGSGKSG